MSAVDLSCISAFSLGRKETHMVQFTYDRVVAPSPQVWRWDDRQIKAMPNRPGKLKVKIKGTKPRIYLLSFILVKLDLRIRTRIIYSWCDQHAKGNEIEKEARMKKHNRGMKDW